MRTPDADKTSPLERYLLVTNVLDQLFRVPGTSWRFGLDAIFGLVPFAGDVVTAMMGAYGLVVAQRLGAPLSIQLRMLLNLAIDAGVGAIPLLGDLFDFAFKANVRNARLLTEWMSRPPATRRSSTILLFAMVLAFIVFVIGMCWLIIAAIRALFQW